MACKVLGVYLWPAFVNRRGESWEPCSGGIGFLARVQSLAYRLVLLGTGLPAQPLERALQDAGLEGVHWDWVATEEMGPGRLAAIAEQLGIEPCAWTILAPVPSLEADWALRAGMEVWPFSRPGNPRVLHEIFWTLHARSENPEYNS